ncbi:MAG: hypothetical protein RHS_2493 [Robinsoniella sp. RHS]|nr:MAG: hypothetical protein RHS_2493 [Robinsoniella sp. RHS]
MIEYWLFLDIMMITQKMRNRNIYYKNGGIFYGVSTGKIYGGTEKSKCNYADGSAVGME